MSQDDLKKLEDFVSGRGEFGHWGEGMSTYPPSDVHEACLELERQGRIVRHKETDEYVVWMPKRPANS